MPAFLRRDFLLGSVRADVAVDQARLQHDSAVGNRLVGADSLQRGLRHALAEQDGVLLPAVPLVGRGEDAARFGGKADVRGFADSELLQPVMPLFLREALPGHDRSRVHGPAEDAGQGPFLSPVIERVSEDLSVHHVGRRDGEMVQRAGLAFFND
ncbi:hypothetical protein D9M72_272380 [compost metagenome]